MDEDGSLHFIEMNTRIQVEHPVTEMVTDVDLVKAQILIAAGEKLSRHHHRSRCTSADTPSSAASMPSILRSSPRRQGRSRCFNMPGGTGIRVDTAAYAEGVIPPYYDSLIAKLVARGRDRDEAISRMSRALDMFVVEGITPPFRCTSASCAIPTSVPATSTRSSWSDSWPRRRCCSPRRHGEH